MSVKKLVKSELAKSNDDLLGVYKFVAERVINDVATFGNKLDKHTKVTFYSRVVAVRNWLTFILLCIICVLLLSSCFVSGRTIHVVTPKVTLSADTATAYSWPYQSNGNSKY